tara:strand:- start:507 stop:638 length:132 start_codon:yes stop_codon:yes gene_type:complete
MTLGPMRKLIIRADTKAKIALKEIYPNKLTPGDTISYNFKIIY